MESGISIFWMRRDLRLEDNHGLAQALAGNHPVLVFFLFDTTILNKLPPRDARVQFIWQELLAIKEKLRAKGSDLLVKYASPEEAWHSLVSEYQIKAVYTNRDYEPAAQARDRKIFNFLQERGIPFRGFKDHVLFEKSEVLKDDGKPYVVFTPYMKRYKSLLDASHFTEYPSAESHHFATISDLDFPDLESMGFVAFPFEYPSREINEAIIRDYHETRDIPSIKGTSRLSLHLRFGTISIRKLAKLARKVNDKFFNELIWRDFYQQVSYHFPHSVQDSFRKEYDQIVWEQNEVHFKAWCEGKTGYPLVDAGMRELNATGFMHNRVRMVVASFLSKHLLLDWRLGEAYFAEKLLDYDAASNVGGWQWAAGSGVDAAPYFRVFNPSLQLSKFDPDLKYIKKWLPEYGTSRYPEAIVDHKLARERAIERYKQALKPN